MLVPFNISCFDLGLDFQPQITSQVSLTYFLLSVARLKDPENLAASQTNQR
jgi:hypothetical protein